MLDLISGSAEPGTRTEDIYRALGWRPCDFGSRGELQLELTKSDV